jgi:hypothetical protein
MPLGYEHFATAWSIFIHNGAPQALVGCLGGHTIAALIFDGTARTLCYRSYIRTQSSRSYAGYVGYAILSDGAGGGFDGPVTQVNQQSERNAAVTPVTPVTPCWRIGGAVSVGRAHDHVQIRFLIDESNSNTPINPYKQSSLVRWSGLSEPPTTAQAARPQGSSASPNRSPIRGRRGLIRGSELRSTG